MEHEEAQEEEQSIIHLLTETIQLGDIRSTGKVSSVLDAVTISFFNIEGVQAARMAFGLILPHLQVDKTSLCLFDVAFSFLKLSYDTFLEGCTMKDATAMSHVADLLQQCCTVSECCGLAMKFLQQAEKIAVEDLGSAPRVFLHIVTSSLTHCKQSEIIYTDQLYQVKDSLSSLFRLSAEVATNFASLVFKLTFDSLQEDDLRILTEVCDKLCTTAVCLSQLSEVRGSVTVWRAYTGLIHQYHGALVTRLDLSPPMTALVNEIKDGLQTLASLPVKDIAVEEKDKKIVQRIIKMTSFCLKVVIALCEKFHGYLMGCHATLVLLILLLFRFSPKNAVMCDHPDDVKTDLEHQVAVGIEPLLMHLRDDEDFIEEVRESTNEETSVVNDWGCHIQLLIAILFPLRSSITHHMNSIVSKIFQATDKGHASLSFPCMMDGVMFGGKPLTAVTLYEHTVMRVCAAVAAFDSQQFELLERDLVHWLLTGQTWSSLLAADVWCFIARYGTSELCKTHCVFLLEILSQTQNTPASNQHLVVAALLSRLMGKLSPSHKDVIMSELRAAKQREKGGGTWLRIILSKSEEMPEPQNSVEGLMQHMNKITSKSANSEDVMNFMESLQETEMQLGGISRNVSAEESLLARLTTPFVLLWTRIPFNYIKCSLVEKLICGLLKVSPSFLSYLSSLQLLQILFSVKTCCLQGSVTVRISICDFMTALGCCPLPQSSHLHATLSVMSDVISDMMKDLNPLVHQYAIDAFVAIGKHTAHEEVLPMCLEGCGGEVREQVTLYLQQTPHSTEQPLLSLLEYQGDKMKKDCTSQQKNDAILIDQMMKLESQQTTSNHHDHHEEFSASKRRRETVSRNGEISDVNILLDSLNRSYSLVKKIKENAVFVDGEDSKKVKTIIERMQHAWDTDESAVVGWATAPQPAFTD
ncbi:uncharacterized protein C1orf112-like isoform X2 [Eriocheir sinensis]|uniref:uncharacterized protein C1orf112-like isoform X2 n=1 Tax=Eriocheir sinensis TaxID=95602 RepID=UPI0021C98A1A|nr:uncharacterized protein C1orf112-like isoform X2 [Eriocheir sinensis]